MSEETTDQEPSPHQGERQDHRHSNQARERLIPALGVLGTLVVVGGLLVLVVILPPGVIRASRPDIRSASAADQLKAENDLRTTLVTMLGGVAVATGTVVAAFGLRETQRQNRKSSDLQRRGQVTERFSKAIDQLGARGAYDVEKLDIRLGGIYALEQIARDTREDDAGDLHWPIVEILTAFINEHTRGSARDQSIREQSERMLGPRLAADIQAALTVLGRRDPARDYGRLELSQADLQRADLRRANLQGADLFLANLKNADLRDANLQKADLGGANLEGASLYRANLQGADLGGANLERVGLRDANLQDADLRGANLQAASLFQQQLDSAICDENTYPPPGLTANPPKDWSGVKPLTPPPWPVKPWPPGYLTSFRPGYDPPPPAPPRHRPPGYEQPPWPPGYEQPPSPGGAPPVPPPVPPPA